MKPRYSLLPWRELAVVVDVLGFGAGKHGDRPERPDWQRPERGAQSHIDAAQRHLAAIHRGEWLDPETGKPHAAHAVARLMMAMWHRSEAAECDERLATAEENVRESGRILEQLRGKAS